MNKFNAIPILASILNDSAKEKVTRIILAVYRNLIEKPTDPNVAKEHCIAMVQCKVLKQLSILEQRRFDDEDITGDVEYLTDKLQSSVQDLSSFDEYATEVKSGRFVMILQFTSEVILEPDDSLFPNSDWNGRQFTSRPNSGVRMLCA